MSLDEARTRKLDVSVKNNKMFYTRERKDIGMVGRPTQVLPFDTVLRTLFSTNGKCHC